MKYTEETYLQYDPFEGERDVKITARTVKIVKTRKPQSCSNPDDGKLHHIPPGTHARYEHALVDGEWGSYYSCTNCMDRWLAETCGLPPNAVFRRGEPKASQSPGTHSCMAPEKNHE